jgi:hypothetical protein
MLKKLFITAAAAAAVSVPFAGVAWADQPADPGSNGVGQGGVPARAGEALNRDYPILYPTAAKVPPGSVFSGIAKTKAPGVSLPQAYSDGLEQVIAPPIPGVPVGAGGLPENVDGATIPATPLPPGTVVVDTTPGAVVNSFTPGCVNGHGPRPSVTINGTPAGVGCIS